MKIGVLGGTFDPVHLGHLIIAEEARLKLGLERVLFVPARQSPLKPDQQPTPAPDRLNMLRLATASNPHFAVSTVDLERDPPSYTVDTIDLLRRELGAETEIYFIVGLDALMDLLRWREPGRLVELCQIVGVIRPGLPAFDPVSFAPEIPRAAERIHLLEVTQIGISSSEIRRRVAAGEPIKYLVPAAVEEYIQDHHLYLGRKPDELGKNASQARHKAR